MPGPGDYLGEMLRAGYAPPQNFLKNLREGVQFGRELGEIPNQNFLMGEKIRQVQRQQAMDAALGKYAQTGDLSGIEALDPNLAAQAAKSHEYIKSRPPESIRVMQAAFGQLQKLGPMINAKNWPSIRKQVLAGYPTLDESDLPPENATDKQIFGFVNAVPLLNAQLKHVLTPYQEGMLAQKAKHEEAYAKGQEARAGYLQARAAQEGEKVNLAALDTQSKIAARNLRSDKPVTHDFTTKDGRKVVGQWDPESRNWIVVGGQGSKADKGKKGDELGDLTFGNKGGGGKGGKQTPPNYPDQIKAPGGVAVKTNRVDGDGRPIYQMPDGSLKVPNYGKVKPAPMVEAEEEDEE